MVTPRLGSKSKDVASSWSGSSAPWRKAGCSLIAVALLSLAGFTITLFWTREKKSLAMDIRATLLFQTFRSALFYRFMTAISSFGYVPEVHLLLVGAAGFLLFLGKKLESFMTLVSAGGAAGVMAVKILVGRPRPSDRRIRIAIPLPDYGFPSGHTVHYVSFFGFLAYLVATQLKTAWLRQLLLSPFILLIMLVGPSRVYLGQHWLSDVVAAYFLGFAYLIGLVEFYKRIKAMRSP